MQSHKRKIATVSDETFSESYDIFNDLSTSELLTHLVMTYYPASNNETPSRLLG